ncbi:type I secretion outer membrane protein, TolC family [Rhizorhabdus wittichii RW1]|uniref:Type I secretion outer membrane protein, TolC family n=2 Tax=Rhizorhabdus wittichii TaxID=160791 RepID=A0A9J9LFR5_RHIWR|nr:type I secretion outer membrane protein, TolC family [Rhizorhabdus wittichii RW1]
MTGMPRVEPSANWRRIRMIFEKQRTDHRPAHLRARARRLMLGSVLLACLPSLPAHAETLMDAVESAYATNPTLVEQRYRQKSTNETYVQTRGQYGPTVSITGQASYSYEKLRQRSLDSNQGELSVSVRQPVYSGGRLRGALAEAHANVRGSQEQLRRVEGEVVRLVIQAYGAVLRDQQRLEVSRENVAALREQLAERKARRKVRDATITDVAQSDARLAAGESQLATAEAQLAITRGDYLRIVGHEPGELQPMPELPGLPETIDEAFAVADQENANLTAARFSEEASRANIAEQRGNKRPQATISASAGKLGPLSPYDRHNLQTDVTAQITITQPIFQAGTISSRIRQAQDQNNAAQAALDGERRQALQDVVLAWSQLSAARVAVVAGRRQVEAAQITFAGMQREEQYGLRSTTDVLNAEQELASAQLTLLSSRYSEYVARASLLLAMGRLDARTVNSAIPARDLDAEFKRVRWRGISPTEPAAMLLDRIGSASPHARPKVELRGANQPKPTGATTMPPPPPKDSVEEPLTPISKSRVVTAAEIPSIVGDYGDPPPLPDDPR